VIDALTGDPLTDRNGDGAVTLEELATEVREAMRYLEKQASGYAAYGVPGSMRLGPARPPAEPLAGSAGGYTVRDYVVAPDRGRKRPGRVVAVRGGQLVVQFYDYSDKRTVTVEPGQVAKAPAGGAAGGVAAAEKPEIEVEWGGQWWPATVVQKNGDKTLIHYVGWGDEWDEWVMKDRMRPLPGAPKPGTPMPVEKAEIEVEWEGQWYPATVLKKMGTKTLIHYVGWGAEWDEWVNKDRIRPLKK
jgi:hypothetical protein